MSEVNGPIQELERLLKYEGQDRIIDSRRAYLELINKQKNIKGFQSGLLKLDNLTGGFEAGEVWVISGIQKHGKTSLCDTITYNMGKQGIPVLWFYFEGNMKYFLEKYQTEEMPLFYVPLELMPNNIEWIEDRIVETKLKYGCNVVIVDHLHYIADFVRLMKNQSLEIGQVMRYLVKNIAVKHNVCVLLVCHVTKVKVDKMADESDLRDSSFISQEASGVITIQRALAVGKKPDDDNPFTNVANIMVCNSRRSGVMRERIKVIKKGHFFYDLDSAEEMNMENEAMRDTWK